MSLHALIFFGGVFLASILLGGIVGFTMRRRLAVAVGCSAFLSILFFAALEWRFGSPDEWSWQQPLVALAYLFGPFVFLVGAPTALSALLVGRWCTRRENI